MLHHARYTILIFLYNILMTGKTHQILGITSGLSCLLTISSPTYGPATLASVLVGSHLMALLPDLDQPAAQIWNSFPFGHTVGRLSDPFLKHRNISHSILGMIIVGLLLHFILQHFPQYWGINLNIVFTACLVAYGSHLLADMFTSEGIPLLYPIHNMIGIPPKPFDGIRILTGEWFENLVIFPLLNLILVLFVYINWQSIRSVLFK